MGGTPGFVKPIFSKLKIPLFLACKTISFHNILSFLDIAGHGFEFVG